MIKSNLKDIFRHKWLIPTYIFSVISLIILWYSFIDFKLMMGNHGPIHTYIDAISSILIAILFPLFLIAFFYRSYAIWKINKELEWEKYVKWENKTTGMWIIWGFFGIIISGSTCCGLTLATTFWLIPLMNFLPFSGLEIKVLSLLMLSYSIYSILSKSLTACEVKLKKRS